MRISRGYRNNNPLNIRRCAKNRWVGLAEVWGATRCVGDWMFFVGFRFESDFGINPGKCHSYIINTQCRWRHLAVELPD